MNGKVGIKKNMDIKKVETGKTNNLKYGLNYMLFIVLIFSNFFGGCLLGKSLYSNSFYNWFILSVLSWLQVVIFFGYDVFQPKYPKRVELKVLSLFFKAKLLIIICPTICTIIGLCFSIMEIEKFNLIYANLMSVGSVLFILLSIHYYGYINKVMKIYSEK